MRTLRTLVAMIVVGAGLWIPGVANADGGAYITFDRTHYLPGETATGEGYIYVPEKHQDLIDRGPFYSYLGGAAPGGGDLYLGTVEFERYAKEEFELHLSFVVPELTGDYYLVTICNDPCTVNGFQEPLTGTISIVATAREAQLLTENEKLGYKNYSLGRKLRKAEKAIEELEGQLATGRDDVLELSAEVSRLERELAAATSVPGPPATAATAADDDRPLVEAWAVFAIVAAFLAALFAIGLALVFSRRHSRIVVPDTVEGLERADDVLHVG